LRSIRKVAKLKRSGGMSINSSYCSDW